MYPRRYHELNVVLKIIRSLNQEKPWNVSTPPANTGTPMMPSAT